MEWSEFLEYLQGPGISIVVGVILSLAVEYWTKYQSLEPKWKRLIFAGLCFVVPLVGAAAAAASGLALWGDFAGHWWPVLVAGAGAFFSGQMAHIRKMIK